MSRAPFHTLAVGLLLALGTGVVAEERSDQSLRLERATSKVGWREGARQTLTSPKIVFYATKNQVSLVHTTKCLTFSKSMTKEKHKEVYIGCSSHSLGWVGFISPPLLY